MYPFNTQREHHPPSNEYFPNLIFGEGGAKRRAIASVERSPQGLFRKPSFIVVCIRPLSASRNEFE